MNCTWVSRAVDTNLTNLQNIKSRITLRALQKQWDKAFWKLHIIKWDSHQFVLLTLKNNEINKKVLNLQNVVGLFDAARGIRTPADVGTGKPPLYPTEAMGAMIIRKHFHFSFIIIAIKSI